VPGKVSDRLAILFGDTWAKATDACKYPLARPTSLQAWLPLHAPSALRAGPPGRDAGDACRRLEIPLDDRGDATSWSKIRLYDDEKARRDGHPLDTGMLRAPNGAFTDGKAIYVMYGSDAVSCDKSRDCPESLLCTTDPQYSGKRLGECSGARFRGRQRDAALLPQRPGLSAGREVRKGVARRLRRHASVRRPDGRRRRSRPAGTPTIPAGGSRATRLVAAAILAGSARRTTQSSRAFRRVASRTWRRGPVRYFDPADPAKNDYRPGHQRCSCGAEPGLRGERWLADPAVSAHQPLEGWGEAGLRENGARASSRAMGTTATLDGRARERRRAHLRNVWRRS